MEKTLDELKETFQYNKIPEGNDYRDLIDTLSVFPKADPPGDSGENITLGEPIKLGTFNGKDHFKVYADIDQPSKESNINLGIPANARIVKAEARRDVINDPLSSGIFVHATMVQNSNNRFNIRIDKVEWNDPSDSVDTYVNVTGAYLILLNETTGQEYPVIYSGSPKTINTDSAASGGFSLRVIPRYIELRPNYYALAKKDNNLLNLSATDGDTGQASIRFGLPDSDELTRDSNNIPYDFKHRKDMGIWQPADLLADTLRLSIYLEYYLIPKPARTAKTKK